MARPKTDMKAHVDLDDTVLLFFYNESLSQTVHLTPEQAIEIGRIGKMAEARVNSRKKKDNTNIPLITLRRTISDMKVGESAYTVPWALAVTKVEKIPYLKLDFTANDKPGGTARMLVQKVSTNTYQVQPPKDYAFDAYDPMDTLAITHNLNII